jgi:NAD(P)-dependent dehydrogenase (short-subunit alcohol dehydrogenase family)
MERAALVTGGSSGIGLAIARMLRDEGFELFNLRGLFHVTQGRDSAAA